MFRHLVTKLGLCVFMLWIMTVVVFIMVKSVPGDPAYFVAGFDAGAEEVQRAREILGLDQPYAVQYLRYLSRLVFHADLGMAITTNRPVAADIAQRLPASLELAASAALLGILVGFPLAVWSAVKRGSLLDGIVRVIGLSGVAVPTFILGFALQLVFYKNLGWLPVGGRLALSFGQEAQPTGLPLLDCIIRGNLRMCADYISHLVLPAACLSPGVIALWVRVFRASLLDELRMEYVTVARAKGLSERAVIIRHAARNALIPVCSLMGNYIGLMIANSILIETVFNWPGVGTYLLRAVTSFDYPAITGTLLVIGAIYMVSNLLIDALLTFLDPSLRYK